MGKMIVGAFAVSVLALATYLIPALLQDGRPQEAILEGEWPPTVYSNATGTTAAWTFEFDVPEIGSGVYDLQYGVRFRLVTLKDSAGEVQLNLSVAVDGMPTPYFRLGWGVPNGSREATPLSAPIRQACPCPVRTVTFLATLERTAGDPNDHAHEFQVLGAVVRRTPVDTDSDGIVQVHQWVHGVPQTMLALVVLVAGGLVLWLAVRVRPRRPRP
jgi:hypothetical protein